MIFLKDLKLDFVVLDAKEEFVDESKLVDSSYGIHHDPNENHMNHIQVIGDYYMRNKFPSKANDYYHIHIGHHAIMITSFPHASLHLLKDYEDLFLNSESIFL